MKTTIAILALILSTACAPVTVERTGSTVAVKATGSALTEKVEDVIDRAHAAWKHACGDLDGDRFAELERLVAALDDRVTMLESKKGILPPHRQRSLWQRSSLDLLNSLGRATEVAKGVKGLIDVFGSHSYSVTVDCQSTVKSVAR